MIKVIFDDLFGPSINEFKKLKLNFINLRKQKKIIDRMKKLLIARSYIINEAEISEINGNKLAYRAFMEADDQIKLAYKYLENELEEIEEY